MTAVPHDQLRPGQRVRVTYEATIERSADLEIRLWAYGDRGPIPPEAAVKPLPTPKLCALCDHDRRQHDATGCASRDRPGLCVCLKFRRPERTP
ncbi:MAG: hypothetical protein JWR88_1027 [Pseudonocardia sp.]|nr:hypothetical protein [Pseudonocardia sp.]